MFLAWSEKQLVCFDGGRWRRKKTVEEGWKEVICYKYGRGVLMLINFCSINICFFPFYPLRFCVSFAEIEYRNRSRDLLELRRVTGYDACHVRFILCNTLNFFADTRAKIIAGEP